MVVHLEDITVKVCLYRDISCEKKNIFTEFLIMSVHRSMTLVSAYLNNQITVITGNKGAHVIVCGEIYCYSYLSRGHRTVHFLRVLVNEIHLKLSSYRKTCKLTNCYIRL